MITIDDMDYILAKVKEHKLPFLGINLENGACITVNIRDEDNSYMKIEISELSGLENALTEFKDRLRQKCEVAIENIRKDMNWSIKLHEERMIILASRIKNIESLMI